MTMVPPTEAQASLLREAGRRALSSREALSFLGGDRPGRTLASVVRHGWLADRGGVLVLQERGEEALAAFALARTRREDVVLAQDHVRSTEPPSLAPAPSPAPVAPALAASSAAPQSEPLPPVVRTPRPLPSSAPEPRTLQAWLLWYSRDDTRTSHRREAAKRRLAALEKAGEDEVLTMPSFDPPDPADRRPERPLSPSPPPTPQDDDNP